jgi:lichenan operon transcriptional antiterminator
VFSIAKELSEKLEEKLDISYTESEINDLAILLSCNTTQQAENELQLEEVIGREELQFVIQILDDLNNTYLLDLNYSSFLARFTVHMKNLTNRIQSNKFISNPLASTLKLSCPFIYEAAVFLATRINQKMHTTLPEDEIGFIAFHIGNAIEELNNLSNKLKTILLFPSYYDMEQTIINRINQYFSNELIIADIITSEEQLSSYSFDYVLSTVPITRPIACPYTMIQPFLTNLDVQVIKKTIAVILSNKRKENLQQKIRNYTSPDLFFRNVSVKNQEEAILLLSEELTSRKMVTDSFTKEVFEREQMSSTAFGKIAIPHSMNMNSPKTSIAVLINDKAIPWKESSVNIVLLIAINFEERRAFRSLFNHLTQALLDFSAKDILSIANYNDFIEFLSNCDSL